MTDYVIPTFMTTNMLYDNNLAAQLAYILKIYLTAPKHVNATCFADMISLPSVIVEHNIDPDKLENTIVNDLNGCISRVYNNTYIPNVNVTVDKDTDKQTYDVTIELGVSDRYGTKTVVDQRFDIVNDKIILNMEGLNPNV